MGHGLLRRLPALALFAWVILTVSAAEPNEPTLVLQTASGNYDLDGERLLVIQDIVGTLSLRAAPDQTLRFEGRVLNASRQTQEVALWREGNSTLLLGPGADVSEDGTLVDMVVPDGLNVEIVLVGGRVLVSAILGDLLVEAQDAKVQARGLRGGGEFLITGGVLSVDGVKGELSYQGKEVQAHIQHLYANADVTVTEGKTTINNSEADLQVLSDRSELEIQKIQGRIRVEGTGGTLRVSESATGGEFQLEESPFTLFRSKGDIAVRTDSLMEFEMHEGAMQILGYGAPVRGSQVAGPLLVENNSTAMEFKQLSGRSEFRGSDLELRLEDCSGPIEVRAVSSQIGISRATAEVDVENEFGDIRIGQTEARLKIGSSGGNVIVTDHNGPMELRADGPEVRVGWTKFGKASAIILHNETGNIHLDLPPTGRCQLQLEAPFGRVDAESTGIRVADDGHTARGEFTGGRGKAPQVKKPTIKAKAAGGNIYVGVAAGGD